MKKARSGSTVTVAAAYSSRSRFTRSEVRFVAMNVFFSRIAHPVHRPIDGLATHMDALLLPKAVGQLLIGCIAADIQQSAQKLQSFFI